MVQNHSSQNQAGVRDARCWMLEGSGFKGKGKGQGSGVQNRDERGFGFWALRGMHDFWGQKSVDLSTGELRRSEKLGVPML
jgi:hypothetical protein